MYTDFEINNAPKSARPYMREVNRTQIEREDLRLDAKEAKSMAKHYKDQRDWREADLQTALDILRQGRDCAASKAIGFISDTLRRYEAEDEYEKIAGRIPLQEASHDD